MSRLRNRARYSDTQWSERQRARKSRQYLASYQRWIDERNAQFDAATPVLMTAHVMAMGVHARKDRPPVEIRNGKIVKYLAVRMPGETAFVYSPEQGYETVNLTDRLDVMAALALNKHLPADLVSLTRRAFVPQVFTQLYSKSPIFGLSADVP